MSIVPFPITYKSQMIVGVFMSCVKAALEVQGNVCRTLKYKIQTAPTVAVKWCSHTHIRILSTLVKKLILISSLKSSKVSAFGTITAVVPESEYMAINTLALRRLWPHKSSQAELKT